MKLKTKNFKKYLLKNKKFLVYFFLILLLFGLLYFKRNIFISATVNRKLITRLSLIRELEKQSGMEVLDVLINESIIFQEARKNKISIEKTQIDMEIAKIEESLKSQSRTLESALLAQGQTREQLEKNIRIKLLITKILADKLTIKADEVEKYYSENMAITYKDKKIEDVRADIENILRDQKLYTEFQNWLKEKRDTYKITKYIK